MLKHARSKAKKSLTKMTNTIGQIMSRDVGHSTEETGKEKKKSEAESEPEVFDLDERKLSRGEMIHFGGYEEEIVHFEKDCLEEKIIFEATSLAGNCRDSVSPPRPPRRKKKGEQFKLQEVGNGEKDISDADAANDVSEKHGHSPPVQSGKSKGKRRKAPEVPKSKAKKSAPEVPKRTYMYKVSEDRLSNETEITEFNGSVSGDFNINGEVLELKEQYQVKTKKRAPDIPPKHQPLEFKDDHFAEDAEGKALKRIDSWDELNLNDKVMKVKEENQILEKIIWNALDRNIVKLPSRDDVAPDEDIWYSESFDDVPKVSVKDMKDGTNKANDTNDNGKPENQADYFIVPIIAVDQADPVILTKANENKPDDKEFTARNSNSHDNLQNDSMGDDMEKEIREIDVELKGDEEEHPGDGISKFIKGSRFFKHVVDIDIDTIPEENEEREDYHGDENNKVSGADVTFEATKANERVDGEQDEKLPNKEKTVAHLRESSDVKNAKTEDNPNENDKPTQLTKSEDEVETSEDLMVGNESNAEMKNHLVVFSKTFSTSISDVGEEFTDELECNIEEEQNVGMIEDDRKSSEHEGMQTADEFHVPVHEEMSVQNGHYGNYHVEKSEIIGPDKQNGVHESFKEDCIGTLEPDTRKEMVKENENVISKDDICVVNDDIHGSSVEVHQDVAKSSDSFHQILHKSVEDSADDLEGETLNDSQENEMNTEGTMDFNDSSSIHLEDGEFKTNILMVTLQLFRCFCMHNALT